MDAKQTPLIDLLERVPLDAVLVVEHDQFDSSSHPVGRLCHEAAAELRRLRMNTINDGGPAFPLPVEDQQCRSRFESGYGGMTLRDFFAAKAMQAQVNNPLRLGDAEAHRLIAKRAYRMADAMLRAREASND